jgi:uncharacterized membrane protein (UPF0127 family)
MFKTSLSIATLILLSSCSTLSSAKKTIANAAPQIDRGQQLPITAVANISEENIQLEVAQTPQQQAIGLMFRESLADNRGMLFPFASERIARFWMKNVPISLDMIFINSDRVVGIAADVPPCETEPCPVYGPNELVDSVIELRGGRAQELDINLGDTIEIQSSNVEGEEQL